MSNTKLSVQEIVDLMVKDRMITKKSAEEFVKVLFSTIEDTLIDGEIVKVKGLGTFKSQWNEARKSVDVNTGEEIIIDGYYRASFVPENELKELINEPFSHLEPVDIEPVTDKHFDENIVIQSEEEKNSENELPEPLRVFEEQAEEIKGLLSEINALSPKMSDPAVSKTDVDLQVAPLNEETPGDNVIIEKNNEQTGENELQSDEPENPENSENLQRQYQNQETIKTSTVATLISNHIINSETEFDLNDFDVVRDISTRLETESADSESVNIEPEEPKRSEVTEELADKGINDKRVKDEPVAGVANVVEDEDFADTNENDLEQNFVDGLDVDEEEVDEVTEEESETEDDDIDDKLNEDTLYVEDEDEEELNEFEDENDNLTDDIEIDNEEENPEINIERKNVVSQNEPSIDGIPIAENQTNLIYQRDLHSSIYEEKEPNDAETAVTAENRPTGEELEKKKRPVWLYSVLGIVVLAGLTWFAFSFIKKDVDEKKNREYMEYLADSTANALKTKQTADSLYQKVDSAETDSVEKQPEKITVEKVPQTRSVSGNVFNTPRNYTRLISTEKIVIGSKLTKFAQHYYGNSNFWVYIFEANRDLISDPDNVPLGITIKIPELDPRLADPKSKESIDFAKKLQSKYLK